MKKGKKVDRYEHEGVIVDIKLNNSTGAFLAEFNGNTFCDTTLSSLKSKLEKAINETIVTSWKPSILLSYRWNNDNSADFQCERILLATKERPDGTIIYFKAHVDSGDFYVKLKDDASNWKPIRPYDSLKGDERENIIPYTPDDWRAINQFKENLQIFNHNIKKLILSKNLPIMLGQITGTEFLKLPKGDKDE